METIIVDEGFEVLDADQGNIENAPIFETGGSLAGAAKVEDFRDESYLLTVGPFVLNEGH